MTHRPDIVIVGPGVVGTTLGQLAAQAGYRIVGVAGRDVARARAAAGVMGGAARVGAPADVAPDGQLVLLTVPDDAIEAVATALADQGALAEGAVVAHCSGALGSDILAAARERCGAAVGSIHPLQTFPDVESAVRRVPGAYFFIEGDDAAAAALTALAEAIGGRPVRIAPEAKLLYHASAVIASNYLVALQDAALAAADRAGIGGEVAAEALRPLVEATLANVISAGPAAALTGPVARGDVELVARQASAVRAADAGLGELYRVLGEWAVGLALRKGSIDEAAAAALRKALAPH